MFMTTRALFSLSALSGALAAPFGASTSLSAGAAYFMTNDPTGNSVISADIATDGSLSIAQSYLTGGDGMNGEPGGPDALYSQGAVSVHAGARLLAVVNPGSSSISLFQIDPDTPSTLTPFGLPISSGGHFPTSVTFSPAGDELCALNSGEINGVQCFKIDSQVGLVPQTDTTRTLGLNQTTPPRGPPNTGSQVIFNEDGSQLVVATKGFNTTVPGFITAWDVTADGLSSNSSTFLAPASGAYPFSLTPIPGRNAFLSADYSVGVDVFDLDSGNSTALVLPNQVSACWSAWSPRTGSYYITDTTTGALSEVNVSDTLVPSLVTTYQFANTTFMVDLEVASLNSTDYLYVLMAGPLSVGVMELDEPGAARFVGAVDIVAPTQAKGLVLDSTFVAGMAVYVKP